MIAAVVVVVSVTAVVVVVVVKIVDRNYFVDRTTIEGTRTLSKSRNKWLHLPLQSRACLA